MTKRAKSIHSWVLTFRSFSTIVTGALLVTGCAINPEKMTKDDIWQEAQKDVDKLASEQEPVQQELTLYDAMARAIKYNREYRLNMMKSALLMQQSELTKFDMLPDLAMNAGYTNRNNKSASSSESYATGQESLEPSTSQDRERFTNDITFTWNVLDFGLSYVMAQQQSDRYLIAKEAERKTIHNIINDVRVAWWKALSAQRMLEQVPPLMNKVQQALDSSRKIEKQRLETPLKALSYQRSLLNMLRILENLQKDLNEAKPQLSFLMGLPSDQKFVIADNNKEEEIPEIQWDVKTMEKIALLSRPELVEGHYKQRISQKESRLALLRLLPNLNLDTGWNHDTNSYLVNQSWYDFGAQLSGSLLNIAKMPATLRNAETAEKLEEQHRLVVSSTILMQLHLAKASHIQSTRKFSLEDLALGVETRILKQKRAEENTESAGEQPLIGQQLNHLLAQSRRDTAYAELRNNFGRLLWTMGVDPVPSTISDTSISSLSLAIKNNIEKWHKSSLPEIDGITAYLPPITSITEKPQQSLSLNYE